MTADYKVIETVCVGGPLDGHTAEFELGYDHFDYLVGDDGLELLEGDMLVGPSIDCNSHRYYLRKFHFVWSTGHVWCYSFWLHESVEIHCEHELFALAMRVHPSDCYVERTYSAKLVQAPSPLIRVGGTIVSMN